MDSFNLHVKEKSGHWWPAFASPPQKKNLMCSKDCNPEWLQCFKHRITALWNDQGCTCSLTRQNTSAGNDALVFVKHLTQIIWLILTVPQRKIKGELSLFYAQGVTWLPRVSTRFLPSNWREQIEVLTLPPFSSNSLRIWSCLKSGNYDFCCYCFLSYSLKLQNILGDRESPVSSVTWQSLDYLFWGNRTSERIFFSTERYY